MSNPASVQVIVSVGANVSRAAHVGDQVLEVNDCCVRSLSHLQAGQKIAQTDGDSIKLLLKTVPPSSRALGKTQVLVVCTKQMFQVPSFSVGEVVYSGWLAKRGGSGLMPKNWRRRWFVLKDDCIAYYYASPAVSQCVLTCVCGV